MIASCRAHAHFIMPFYADAAKFAEILREDGDVRRIYFGGIR